MVNDLQQRLFGLSPTLAICCPDDRRIRKICSSNREIFLSEVMVKMLPFGVVLSKFPVVEFHSERVFETMMKILPLSVKFQSSLERILIPHERMFQSTGANM